MKLSSFRDLYNKIPKVAIAKPIVVKYPILPGVKMLACKGIFATPSIDAAVVRPHEAVRLQGFYAIKSHMQQLYNNRQKKSNFCSVF